MLDSRRWNYEYRSAVARTLLKVQRGEPLSRALEEDVDNVLSLKQFEDRNAEQASLRIERGELQKADIPLREARQKLAQIRQWEPILNNRIPISSLLNAIQVSITQNAALDTISIEAEQFDHLPVLGGMYRVPRDYRLVLQGLERPGGGDAWLAFSDALQKRFPTGSELIRSERLEKRSDGCVPFLLQ